MSRNHRDVIRLAADELVELLGPLVRGDERLDFEESLERIQSAQDDCLARLSETGLLGRDNQLPSGDFWKTAGWVVGHGPLQLRAREKPHGYAGDFEMLDQIADDRISEELLPGAFDRYFQNQAAPKAVRNRTRLIADRIVELARAANGSSDAAIKICSVGSGSAPDIRRAVEQLNSDQAQRLDIHLFDLDPKALAFAEEKLRSLNVRSQSHRVNLFRLAKLPRLTELLSDSTLIFCSGLFDYLTHADAVAMLQAFWSQLVREGQLLAFNFAEHSSRAYMEWFGNWYLEYRDVEAMHRMAVEVGWRDSDYDVHVEPENVNLFIAAQK